jgi:hypothetical protein
VDRRDAWRPSCTTQHDTLRTGTRVRLIEPLRVVARPHDALRGRRRTVNNTSPSPSQDRAFNARALMPLTSPAPSQMPIERAEGSQVGILHPRVEERSGDRLDAAHAGPRPREGGISSG